MLVNGPDDRRREEFHATPEWQLACRIAANRRLAKSELLRQFLLYICEQSLTGNPHRITEQKIGTLIFNRASDYNPGEDNIVRSYARMLRKRLDEYFATEGNCEPLRIVIPRGGYLPTFETFGISGAMTARNALPPVHVDARSAELPLRLIGTDGVQAHGGQELPTPLTKVPGIATTPEDAAQSVANTALTPNEVPASGASRGALWTALAVGMLAGALVASAAWLSLRVHAVKTAPTLAHPLWAQMFQHDRDTLIVPADSGLGIVQNLTGKLISLAQYANGSYASDTGVVPGVDLANLNDLRHQRYTSFTNLDITSRLTQLPEFATGRPKIRYARGITIEDLKSANVILIGSSHTDPWVSLFDKDLNFRLKYMPEVDQSFVENEHPQGNEQKQYYNQTTQTNRTYGTIDYVPSLDGRGHTLIIQGLNMAATQAAADTLFDSPSIESVLQHAALPRGGLRNFELLVETSSIGATDPSSQIIAMRIF